MSEVCCISPLIFSESISSIKEVMCLSVCQQDALKTRRGIFTKNAARRQKSKGWLHLLSIVSAIMSFKVESSFILSVFNTLWYLNVLFCCYFRWWCHGRAAPSWNAAVKIFMAHLSPPGRPVGASWRLRSVATESQVAASRHWHTGHILLLATFSREAVAMTPRGLTDSCHCVLVCVCVWAHMCVTF